MPDRVVAPGYMWMSGTSFAAPVVSGAAAQILARHPDLTPDQVKGALMLTANYLAERRTGSRRASARSTRAWRPRLDDPPNPNEGFQQFIQRDPDTGGKSFDSVSWNEYVSTHASWAEASWNSASWAEASWNAASWAEASWNAASWNSSVDSMMTTLASYSESTFAP